MCGEPFAADVPDDEEDLTLGYRLPRLPAEAEHTLVEIVPGVWRRSAQGVTYLRTE